MSSTAGTTKLHVDILLIDPRGYGVQWQDFSPVDLLGNLTLYYINTLVRAIPSLAPLLEHAVDFEFHCIADALERVTCAGGVSLRPLC